MKIKFVLNKDFGINRINKISFSEIEKNLKSTICKNLFLVNSNKSQYYLLMLKGHKKFKTKVISKQINSSRLSFGSDEKMLEYLDITPGSVSVLGLMNDHEHHVQLLVDKDLLEDEGVDSKLIEKNKEEVIETDIQEEKS